MAFAGTSAKGKMRRERSSRSRQSDGKVRPKWVIPIALLDDLVGAGEEGLRHGEAERLGGLEVDNQLEFGLLLDRQIGRLLTFQDSRSVDAGLAPDGDVVNSIADQAAGRRHVGPRIDRRNGMA